MVQQVLTLADQAFGLLFADRVAAEGCAFQQRPHLMSNRIALLLPGRDRAFQAGVNLVIVGVTRQSGGRNFKTAETERPNGRIDLFVDAGELEQRVTVRRQGLRKGRRIQSFKQHPAVVNVIVLQPYQCQDGWADVGVIGELDGRTTAIVSVPHPWPH